MPKLQMNQGLEPVNQPRLIEFHMLFGSLETFVWPTAEIHRLGAQLDRDDIAAPSYDKHS